MVRVHPAKTIALPYSSNRKGKTNEMVAGKNTIHTGSLSIGRIWHNI